MIKLCLILEITLRFKRKDDSITTVELLFDLIPLLSACHLNFIGMIFIEPLHGVFVLEFFRENDLPHFEFLSCSSVS